MNSTAQQHRTRLHIALLAGMMSLVGSTAALASPQPKQLAGGPEEFTSMRAPDPTAATVHSKSALLPVELSAQADGRLGWQGQIPAENGKMRFLVIAADAGHWETDLISPSGVPDEGSSRIEKSLQRTQFGIEQAQFPADHYSREGVESGLWTLKLSANPGATPKGFVLIEGDDTTELASHQSSGSQRVGSQIGFSSRLTATGASDQVLMGKSAGQIQSAMLRVTSPNGAVASYSMFDDGMHDDALADDGVYGARFAASAAGQYLAQVVVSGTDRFGQPLIRTTEHPVPVLRSSIALSTTKSVLLAQAIDGGRLQINLPVTVNSKTAATQHYRAYAELWGQSTKGEAQPVAWIGGMVEPKQGALGLTIDERWVARSGARAPFELRNLRIEDPDYFVSLAEADKVGVSLPASRMKSAATDIEVDDSMRMGPRPASLSQSKASGSRLLLVHGYCSGGVWPTSQFSNASTFLDANQNRSHDQFARLIQSFGASWNSFGIVAHSQGGPAALHLYTYYWSGLDNAGSGRLIQSVGSPYKGTNLAGILASIGNVFGVGCGNNANLSYSGASSWLAGIPNSARAKVNYYTTSFKKTYWWVNDYCNFATDLVLSDPEDGTTEQTNGQLSGAVNRGHVTGQCHTAGMRDPAQYLNSSRNSTMNSNAAR